MALKISAHTVRKLAEGILAVAVESIPIHRASNFSVKKKDDGSPVSNLDIANQHKIVALVRSCLDNIPILAEEDEKDVDINLTGGFDTYVTVDPIDGTSPCAAGYTRNWNVAVGFVIDGTPALGLVGMPSEGKVLVGGPLIGEVYTLDSSGLKQSIKRAENKNKLWGMDMAPDVAKDLFLAELNRRLVADADYAGYPANVPSVQSGIDLVLGHTKFFLTGNSKMWDICPIAAFASELGYVVQHVDGSSIIWTPPHRNKLKTVILAESREVADGISETYDATLRVYQEHKDRIHAAWKDD